LSFSIRAPAGIDRARRLTAQSYRCWASWGIDAANRPALV
jgi:hypothetical protein